MNKQERAEHQALIADMRYYLLHALKLEFGDICQMCRKHYDNYDIDHKRYAHDITILDLQLLCEDCHKAKTLLSWRSWRDSARRTTLNCTTREDLAVVSS